MSWKTSLSLGRQICATADLLRLGRRIYILGNYIGIYGYFGSVLMLTNQYEGIIDIWFYGS